jgi:ligand-binding sensor domain-containing protein
MLKKLILTFSCTAMICMAVRVSAQPFAFRTYSLSEGLPQSQVTCTHIDHQGYLWIGTNGGGLCRFDGKEFEVYSSNKGMNSNFIRCLAEDQKGRLCVGTDRGLYLLGRHFYQVEDDTHAVNYISTYGNDSLLIGFTNNIKSYNSTHGFYNITRDSIGTVLTICHQNNMYWFGTSKGLWKLDPLSKQIQFIGKMIGQGIYHIAAGLENELWLASWNAGIIKYNILEQKIDTVIRDPSLLLPQCIYNPGHDKLWVGTQNKGLVLINLGDQKISIYAEKEGLPHVNVRSITPGENDQLWIGTSGGGLVLCTKQNFRQFDKSDGLAANRVYAVIAGQQRDVWMASGNLLQHFDSTGFKTFPLDSLTFGSKCKTLAKDHEGRIWIGTEGKGIVVLDKNETIIIDRRYGLPDGYIQKIAVDQSGKIWVGTFTNGLYSIELDSNHHVLVSPHALPFKKISSLYIDRNNHPCIGSTDGRFISLRGDVIELQSDTSSGLPRVALKSIAEDTFGRIWIGTEGKGIYFKPKGEAKFESSKGSLTLNSQNIYLMLCDPQGNIWVGTEKGVNKITFKKDGGIDAITSFGQEEGFTGIETCHDASTVDDQGNLWFGTMNGLMRYTPGLVQMEHYPPKVHFENISLFYKPLFETKYKAVVRDDNTIAPNTAFHYRDNHLNFEFKAVDLLYPDDLWYRWKLNGIEDNWSPPSHQTSVNYAALHPGFYYLQVQAAVDTLQWSEPIEASFSIKPAYWQTILFRTSAIAFGGICLTLIIYGWTRTIKKREAAKRKQLEIENNILHLEQKSLQLQMNPHFLFNALTSIKSLVGKEHLEEAQLEINAFAQLMRGILSNSRKQVITLAEEINVLEKYLHIEQLCHQNKFQYSIQTLGGIDPEEFELPPMLIQPFVENAVVHGVAHLLHEGRIEILFEKEEDILVCEITDNGIGRERAARLREEKKPGHQPVAVEVTRERLEALRGDKKYIPYLIEDIPGENGNISGTKVTIRLPLIINW